MKMLKYVVLALVAMILVAVRANPLPQDVAITVIQLEEPCVRQGGICLHYDDCDSDNQVQYPVHLCPNQKHLGVVCCYI